MAARSAGILLYRERDGILSVLLVHPGGPFWAKKDLGAWSIPKGEYQEGGDPAAAALREFEEELGTRLDAPMIPLGEITQKAGKRVTAFAMPGDIDARQIRSNHFTIEWPPRSREMRSFPEVDRAEWFSLEAARAKLLPAQLPFLDRLALHLGSR